MEKQKIKFQLVKQGAQLSIVQESSLPDLWRGIPVKMISVWGASSESVWFEFKLSDFKLSDFPRNITWSLYISSTSALPFFIPFFEGLGTLKI